MRIVIYQNQIEDSFESLSRIFEYLVEIELPLAVLELLVVELVVLDHVGLELVKELLLLFVLRLVEFVN